MVNSAKELANILHF